MATKLHSNYQIRWKNYRRFEDTGWLTLTPLTILLGANNGGKSSVLSPLLLLMQTFNSTDSEAPLVSQGPIIDLGNYKDFVHNNETQRELFFGLRFHTHDSSGALKEIGTYPPGGIEWTFKAGEKMPEIRLQKYEVTDIYNRLYFKREAGKNGFGIASAAISRMKMTAQERKALSAETPTNFLFAPNDVLYEIDRSSGDKGATEIEFSKDFSHYLRACGFSYTYARGVLQNLSYIGPLRAKLQRVYRLSGELPDTVGSQGEHAANLFRRKIKTLKPRIDAWVKAFEFGDELRYDELSEDLFRLQFVNAGQVTNIADAGFGASQVLPLIVQAVAAPEDSLTLAEQPEIHLNPKLQCVLADLFVEMATSGHRVLVETHSEHLILRLRRLVAEGKIPAKDVSLYFVEKESGVSTIRKIPVEADGGIEAGSWPKGFFGDGLRESLALASAQAMIPIESAVKKSVTKESLKLAKTPIPSSKKTASVGAAK
jgi:hypothetical protein